MDVSVIIVNYNTCKMTCECIDSIVEKTKDVEYEIILVDNASTDGSKEFFEKDSRIKYIYSERNGGFGYGNNLGMKVAKGKYFFLLNSDTLLINNAIKEFYDYAENNQPHTLYCCYVEDKDGKDNGDYLDFPILSVKELIYYKIKKRPAKIVDHKAKEVDAVHGANMFLPRQAYEVSGGFDENIFMYGEEIEWQLRLHKLGLKRMIIPQPRIIHFGGVSTKKANTRFANQGFFITLRKHSSWWNYLILRLYYAFGQML